MTDDPCPLHLQHLVPPLLICGLVDHSDIECPSNNALYKDSVSLESRFALVNSPLRDDLTERFREKSQPASIWQPSAVKASRRQLNHFLHINFAGRTIRLPAIKRTVTAPESGAQQNLYPDGSDTSILSPSNPKSCLYPNGVFTTEWIEKYNYILPANIVMFYNLDTNAESDKQLSQELLKFKQELESRNIKISVVLVEQENSTEHERLVQDRIYNLRSSTGLQSRTGLFLLQRNSNIKEREALVESLCQQAYSRSLEFYTLIAKNIRRKRGKRHVLSSSQMSDNFEGLPLSSAGWQARYDFKLSILSELRQDLQFTLGCYETAYDSILELFETLSPIEERGKEPWSQARLLLDSVAFKIIRCCLYEHQGTAAFRKFDIHIDSVSAIIEQRGISRESYQYVNWLAEQYSHLAELINLSGDALVPKHASLVPGSDSISPKTRLPRSGFLFLEAAELIQGLENLPKSEDPYMSFKFNYGEKLEKLLSDAVADFSLESDGGQSRSINYSYYQLGETFYNKTDYVNALKYYKQAADIYRKEKWHRLLMPLLARIEECAEKISSAEDIYYAKIEKAVISGKQCDLTDIPRHGDETRLLKPVNLGLFSYSFAFENDECYRMTDTLSQLYLLPVNRSMKIQLSQLRIEFEGAKNIVLEHDESKSTELMDIRNDKANLTFEDGKPRIFQLRHHPEQLGEIRLKKIVGVLKTDAFSCELLIEHEIPISGQQVPWYTETGKTRHLMRKQALKTEVLPRPSRIKISHNLEGAVAVGENVSIAIEVLNMETEEINLTLDAAIKATDGENLSISWDNEMKNARLAPDETIMFQLLFQVPQSLTTSRPLTLELTSVYEALSEPGMMIKDALSQTILVSRLFRIDFGMAPLVHPDSWPSLFVPDEEFSSVPKIIKRWDLSARILFVGDAQVDILGANLIVKSDETTEYSWRKGETSTEKDVETLSHNDVSRKSWSLDCHEKDEREVRTISAEAGLTIKWKRHGSERINELISSPVQLTLPLYEPRVIVDMEKSVVSDVEVVRLKYYVENATSHILTYSVSISSSSAFSFQGIKKMTLKMLPFTRKVLEYVLIPLSSGKSPLPQLKVHDTYYKRTLVIISANKEILQDRNELYIVV